MAHPAHHRRLLPDLFPRPDARRRPGTAGQVSPCFWGKGGGRTRTRTLDPLIKSQLLYQLSYAPHVRRM